MKEVWKEINGYKDYQVSNMGQVASFKSGEKVILKQKINRYGYCAVVLSGGTKKTRKDFTVHRLVAIHFVDGYADGLQVNHLNEIKTDNRADNLMWATAKENANYGSRNIRMAQALSLPVVMLDNNGQVIKRFSGINQAERETGIKLSSFRRRVLENKKIGGYRWAYAN